MNKIEIISSEFNDYIKEATSELHNNNLVESYKVILKALNSNPNAPEPHNLLGIWYELIGNEDLARKHYRAAYALDPSYKPSSTNLERVCTMFSYEKIPYDFGEDALLELEKNILNKKENVKR